VNPYPSCDDVPPVADEASGDVTDQVRSTEPTGRVATPTAESPGTRAVVAGSRRTLALFGLAALAFGTSFAGVKFGLATVPPLLFAALRFDIAALLLVTALAVTGRLVRPRRRDLPSVLVTATFLIVLNGALFFLGQQFVPAGTAAVLFAVVPLATPLFAAVLLADERVSVRRATGLVVGFAGVAVIVAPEPAALVGALAGGASGSGLGSAPVLVGHLLVLGAATSVALGSVLSRRVTTDLPLLVRTAYAMVIGAVANHGFSLAAGDPTPLSLAWSPAVVLAVAYVGVVSTAIAFPAYFTLIDSIGAVRANLVAYAVPVVATVAGAVVLGEAVVAATVLGFLVVAAGFAVVEAETLVADLRRARARARGRRIRTDGGADAADAVPVTDRTHRRE
jgi:drug/metabolite transporter (DMT)-like permease